MHERCDRKEEKEEGKKKRLANIFRVKKGKREGQKFGHLPATFSSWSLFFFIWVQLSFIFFLFFPFFYSGSRIGISYAQLHCSVVVWSFGGGSCSSDHLNGTKKEREKENSITVNGGGKLPFSGEEYSQERRRKMATFRSGLFVWFDVWKQVFCGFSLRPYKCAFLLLV